MADNFIHADYRGPGATQIYEREDIATQVVSSVSGDTTSVATPRAPLLIANDGSVSVYFTPAANATSYRATLSNGSTATGTVSPITITSANGAAVTATITGINATTSATSSASNSVTPTSKPAALTSILGMMAWWDANQPRKRCSAGGCQQCNAGPELRAW